jgi:hypothetical protein
VRSLFEAQDLEVSDASDGAGGVRKAQAENPTLIILDLSMPVMSGLEALPALGGFAPVHLLPFGLGERGQSIQPSCYLFPFDHGYLHQFLK